MNRFFNILTHAFDLLLLPFCGLPPFWGLAAVSLLTAIFILLVYRFASNQEAIRREKKRIQGHFLGIYLFGDSVRQIFLSLGRLLLSIVRYLAHSLPSLLIVIVPILLVCVQLDLRYGRRGAAVGERLIVAARFEAGQENALLSAELQATDGAVIETPPLHIPSLKEVDWRIRVVKEGTTVLKIAAGENKAEKVLIASAEKIRIYPTTGKPSFRNAILTPGDAFLPVAGPIASVSINYPARRIDVLGWQIHWAIVYFALAIVFGFILKRPLGVEF